MRRAFPRVTVDADHVRAPNRARVRHGILDVRLNLGERHPDPVLSSQRPSEVAQIISIRLTVQRICGDAADARGSPCRAHERRDLRDVSLV